MNETKQRKKKFIDNQVQTGIVMRVVVYVISGILFVSLPIALINTLYDPSRYFHSHIFEAWTTHWPVFATSLALIPFIMFDAIRFSNRFAGPVFRLRDELRRFATTQQLRSFQFRREDYWSDLPVGMNRIANYIQHLEQENAELKANLHTEEEATAAV